ncbi:Sec-independent protein translocase protein TatB [Pasteurella multocida]|uniref:Sec-independent protein translocase protein TatB n=1 Tax=Pasteurella multocida TaxID=747 RepID=UPI00244B4387|nr:Sec-independent protein translocase protein TatB [Pasteurella multocida]MDH3002109.1 sec-independent translocase [Pasteurella multocida]
MFDIGFSELFLILIIGLIVLGPKRLPVAIRTVMGWVATIRGLASNVQNELKQELKLQELQESIKKAEALNIQQLSPELSKTVEELRASAEKMRTTLEQKAAAANTTLEEQIKEMKNATDSSSQILTEQLTPSEQITEATIDEALSPAEQAELAEENNEMVYIQQYYPDDYDNEPVLAPELKPQTEEIQDKKA